MNSSGDDSVLFDEEGEQTAKWLEAKLLSSLAHTLPQSQNTGFVLTARDPATRQLIGGVCGPTSYGWLLIKILWVEEQHRHLGIGQALMQRAQQKAIAHDCHHAWLDTSNPQAMRFYQKLGYSVFGQLSNGEGCFPESHHRWFMKKVL